MSIKFYYLIYLIYLNINHFTKTNLMAKVLLSSCISFFSIVKNNINARKKRLCWAIVYRNYCFDVNAQFSSSVFQKSIFDTMFLSFTQTPYRYLYKPKGHQYISELVPAPYKTSIQHKLSYGSPQILKVLYISGYPTSHHFRAVLL